MPTEMRHLIFLPAEVVQAVRMYKVHMGAPLPPGSVQDFVADVNGPTKIVRFRFTLVPDLARSKGAAKPQPLPLPEQFVVIEGPALAAALLLFCHSRAIPMAAKAEKRLDLMGKNVCLVATINMPVSEPA